MDTQPAMRKCGARCNARIHLRGDGTVPNVPPAQSGAPPGEPRDTMKSLKDMSTHELENLIKEARERIDELEALEQLKTMETIQNLAKQAGLEVTLKPAGKRSRARGATPAKYRNPANARETWSGRGRKPKWVEKALESGKTLDEMAVG